MYLKERKMRKYQLEIKDFIESNLDVVVFGEGKPEVLITGAIHGGEATGVYASKLLFEYLETHKLLKGSVKIISVCNPTAFRRMERTSPYDNLDMNRIFPGDPNGSLTQRVCNALWVESQTADYIIDLHCCGVWGSSYILGVFSQYPKAKKLAAMLDIPIAVQSGGTPGQLFVETCALDRAAVIIELPGGGEKGMIDQDAGQSAYEALVGMLIQLEMTEGEYRQPNPRWCDRLLSQKAQIEGLFVPQTKAGEIVKQGQVLGSIAGQPILAPVAGTLSSMSPMRYVFKGSSLGNLAPHIKLD